MLQSGLGPRALRPVATSHRRGARRAAPRLQSAVPLGAAVAAGYAVKALGRARKALARRPGVDVLGGLGEAGSVRSSPRRQGLVQLKGLQTGIVGLPNVGKSTLFNALCDTGEAEAGNFPFCTIDPNMGKAKARRRELKASHTPPAVGSSDVAVRLGGRAVPVTWSFWAAEVLEDMGCVHDLAHFHLSRVL